VIGDLRTVALVSVHGDLDWLCWPRFDSPSVFAALLDSEKGGHFLLRGTCADTVCRQRYWAETNVLVTRFYSSEGVGEVVDFMTVEEEGRTLDGPRRIIRQVRCARGKVEFELVCQPAFDYARERHTLQLDARGALFSTPSLSLRLSSPIPLQGHDEGSVHARFWLEEGHDLTFTLQPPERPDLDRQEARAHFRQTIAYWRHWLSHCTYRGRWRELVHRSALALKLLIYAPTGAIVAAPTASLPEFLGGTRNWDYRYTWIRDAAFTLYALMRIGFTREAGAFMRWLQERIEEGDQDGSLPLMYRIDGRRDLHEEELTHLSGYRGSRPVRVGNDAMPQLQLDIYGELMDSVYLYNKYGEPISDAFWCHLRRTLNWVCDHWDQPDQGIWEVRGPRQHFVYSKLMCWVALDRGLRLAEKRSFPAERHRWLEVRDTIYEEIIARGWNEDRQAFSQAYGSDSLDASNLIMPLVFFMSPTDPRMLATLDAVGAPTRKGGLAADGLLYRYDAEVTQDGLAAENEGTFNICSFWLIEAQTRAGKNQHHRLERARHLFERLQGYANHLGLFAEQIGPRGEALGNFPQALTHLSLISAAYNLDRALGERD
jgi:GH15 family glucan-1,4-alpha-glucosidase